MKKEIKKITGIVLVLALLLTCIYNKAAYNKCTASAGGIPEAVCVYQFNNSPGTAEAVVRNGDTTEGGNSGTIPFVDTAASVKYAEGISGKGIYLDGTYGLKLYPGLASSSYTVSLWVKPEEERLYSNIFYAGTGLLTEEEKYFSITSDDTATPVVLSSSTDGGYYIGNGKTIESGRWSHICMAVNGTDASIYINGKLYVSGNVPAGICNKNTQYYLGTDCYNIPFKGCIDNIAFYNTCISETQAESIYNNGKNTPASGKVTGISLNKSSLYLNGYGSSEALYASIAPGNAQDQAVEWQSSDKSAATVNNGVVTALKNGNTVITAITEDGGYKAECKVTIEGIPELENIALDKTDITLEGDGSSAVLTVNPVPAAAHIPGLLWSSSDSNVAEVKQDGSVYAIANGSADIKAQTEDGAYIAVCHVTVQGVSKEVTVSSVEFTEDSIKLDSTNKNHQLIAVVTPASAVNKECVYYSEDNSIAVVDDLGMVKAVGNGTTNICVISNDGRFTSSCKVSVSGFKDTAVKKLELDKENIKVERGGTGYLYVKKEPVASDEVLDWSSNNPDAVDVVADEYGMSAEVIVYEDAVMGSTAIITVSSETGVSAECFVEVTEYGVKKIDMDHKNLYMLPGESYEMEADIVPREAEGSEIIWNSSNIQVAQVDGNGVIKVQKKAKAGSTAIITSSNITRTKESKCKVIVKSKKVEIKKLSTIKRNISLYPGQKADMAVKYMPSDATDVQLSYISNNPGIVKVSKSGKISVPSGYKGTAEVKVTAKSKNGKKVSSVIKVKQKKVKIKKLSMSRTVLDLYEGNNTTLYAGHKPANATQSNIKWSSSNRKTARVTGNGSRATVRAGSVSSKKTVTVKAKDINGATAVCRISVYPKPPSVTGSNNSSSTSPGTSQPGGSSRPSGDDKPSGSNKPASPKIRKLSFGSNYVLVSRGSGRNLKTMLAISPVNANDDLVWKCSSKYASVNQAGYITVSGKAQKNTNISVLVYSKGNSLAKASIIISVKE